ncbi:MAG TPA: ABC transporter ATP-binding protein, partial [Alcanivorax sp.]|nr:ABC transporter ATP-binding protein [Alcanivorax sp.]HBS15787.1 ABC transporter ATP-binding protein [Alcanivorax sp.]
RGLSIVVSEQVLSFVMEIADRILVIEKGDIVHQEDKEDADQNKIASYLAV